MNFDPNKLSARVARTEFRWRMRRRRVGRPALRGDAASPREAAHQTFPRASAASRSATAALAADTNKATIRAPKISTGVNHA